MKKALAGPVRCLRPMVAVFKAWLRYPNNQTPDEEAAAEFLENHIEGGRVLPEVRTGKFEEWVNDNLPQFYRRSKHSPPTVTTRSSKEATSSDAGSIPRGEMEPPMEAGTNLPPATENKQVDIEKTIIALQIYPFLSPDAANTLHAMSLKIAANCRAVEQSRAQYLFDNQGGWNYYHIPLVKDMTRKMPI